MVHTLRINAHNLRGSAQGCARSQRCDHDPYTSNQRSQTEGVARKDARAPSAAIMIHTLRINAHKLRGVARKDARAPSATIMIHTLRINAHKLEGVARKDDTVGELIDLVAATIAILSRS